ncbi:hypothetical protein EI983_08665 [Roseovarius faecimaris]|uniref:Uncharacterized protein n=1 Tax=Roseovarius faecimaris TaxID=2494550 RepID=A0A6I6J0H9_9RHOB|nr:lysylphosphatidylglycerol synthase domain-containing protein [Roseovarius faecimaris]QGX98348.1 hypothetical protein EI983_08665 [Roseovarius faecimaris]
MQRRYLIQILSGLIGILLILLMFWALDLSLSSVLELPQMTPLWVLFAVAALTGANQLLGVMKWKLAAAQLAPGADAPDVLQMARITTIGTLFAQIIPMPVSMALTRWLLATRQLRASGFAARSTFYEQVFDIVIMVCTGLASLAMWLFGVPGGGALAILVITCAISLFAVRSILDLFHRLTGWLAARRFAAAKFEQASDIFAMARDTPFHQCLLQSALSLCRLVLQLMRVLLLVTTFIPDIDVLALLIASPAVILIGLIPLTPGGLGVIEWTWSSFLISLGASVQMAALVALVFRVFVFIELALVFTVLTAMRLVVNRLCGGRG